MTQLPTDGRVRKPPGWLQRPVPVPAVKPPTAAGGTGERPGTRVDGAEATPPEVWERVIDGARPADVRDIARLVREPTLADRIPIRIPQRLAFWHAIGAWFTDLTLRVRVAAFVALVVGVTVATLSAIVYFTASLQYYNALDDSLRSRAEALLNTPLANPTNLSLYPPEVFLAQEIRVGILSADGTMIGPQVPPAEPKPGSEEAARIAAGRANLPPHGPLELKVAAGGPGGFKYTERNAQVGDQEFRVVALELKDEGTRAALVLAQSTEDIDRTLRSLGTALLIMGVTGVLLAAYAGVLVARQGLRPVGRLTRAAEHVAATGELRPIEVRGDDELARLGRSFNAMLEAVERSRDTQRRLVADAGHELRTPLTSLRTNLDLLKQAESMAGLDPTDKAELIEDVRAQVEELTGLVSDLVELARDDVEKSEDRPVDLAETVAAAVDRARRRAPDVHFDVRTRPWTVLGDARALERAVLNLLDNAGKWSPAGGTVTVRLSDGLITVADQGPGIAEADLPYVFERFYRSDESRTMSGSGLGLAIVRQAAERHGGTVTADRAPQGGALMKLRLPHSSSVTHTEH